MDMTYAKLEGSDVSKTIKIDRKACTNAPHKAHCARYIALLQKTFIFSGWITVAMDGCYA